MMTMMTRRTTTTAPNTPPSTGPTRSAVTGEVVVVAVVGENSVVESVVEEVEGGEGVVGGGEKAGLELWVGVGVLVTSGTSGSKDEVKPLPRSGEDVGRSCIAVVVVVGAGWAGDSMEVTERIITEELS